MLSKFEIPKEKKEDDSQRQKTLMWETYNQKRLLGSNITDQTKEFFNAIASTKKDVFLSSTKRVVQFGVSTGDYLKTLHSPSRSLIGYDYSKTAIKYINEAGIEGRLVDLNEIAESTTPKRLAYQPLLEKDLSISSELLIIRLVEYLNPEALKLFIFSILNLAKSDSKFYFEIFSTEQKDQIVPSTNLVHRHNLKTGYIPSFFAPRVDMEFVSYKISHNEENDKCSGADTTVERLILRKI